MAELINEQDSLNQGRVKINESILASERAERNANEALSQSESTQTQLDTIVINGDSSVEAAQARVDENGHAYSTLKDRLDTENIALLNQIGDSVELPSWLQESLRQVSKMHDDYLRQFAINVRQPPYNAPADGSSHPLSERYETLEEAQKIFTSATSLDDEIDWAAIQSAIDSANDSGIRKVFIPASQYLIDKSIVLNGCTLYGDVSNIFSGNAGTRLLAKSDDFTVLTQGSMSSNDIQFNIKDIYVQDAMLAFEINYTINSLFERLYAVNCDIGYKLGDLSAVGSMFCEFNNLYTRNTRIGAIVQSKDYFNNNRFNNGFITGTEKAFHLEVQGGYGAVNNVFNNVEFRSPLGRGFVVSNALNTTFNHCYFETGGNAIRAITHSTINIRECVFGLFKAGNTNGDKSFVFAEGGFRMKVDGGEIFLTSENNNTSFYDATNPATYGTVYMINVIRTNGSATNFIRFKQQINEIAYQKEERVVNTATVTVPAGEFVDIPFTYPVPFSKTPDVCIPTLRGSGFQGNTLYHAILSESRADGGSIRIYNVSSSTDRQIYFSIYAKVL